MNFIFNKHVAPTHPDWPIFSDEQIQGLGKVLPTVISIADRLNEVGRRTTSSPRNWLRGDLDLHQTLDNYIFYFGIKLRKVIENERDRVNAMEVYGAFIQAKRDEQEHNDFVDQIQLALDVAGLIPVVGIPFTIAGTGLAASRGDWLTASVNLLTLVPFLGGAAKASELGKNIKDVSKAVDSSGIVKIAGTIDETGKITKAVQEARINVAAALEAGATTTEDIAKVVKDSKIADAAGSAEKIIAEVKATAQDAGVAQELAKAKKAADALRSLPNPANCFGAGTPLLISGSSISIEELRPGDWVLSRSEFDPDGAIEAKQIEEIFVRVGLIRCIHIGGQVVRTTDEHPFFVVGKGWVQASLLEVGDLCIGHDGKKTVVDGVEETRRIETLYNLRVADYHTYFVGCQEWGFSVWAHNTICGEAVRTALAPRIGEAAARGLSTETLEEIARLVNANHPRDAIEYLQGLNLAGLSPEQADRIVRTLAKVPNRAAPEVVVNALRNYNSRRYTIGDRVFQLDRERLKHILERHHPEYFNGRLVSEVQTFFPRNMSVEQIESIVGQVLSQNRQRVLEIGMGIGNVQGVVNGTRYTVGLNTGRIGQLVPLP